MPGQLIPSIISAGGSLIGDAVNAIAQGANNRKQRKWAESMYARQRQDALDDWNRQNEYNSPVQQAARLQAAGFNKNLIVGGSMGGSDAGPVRSSDTPQWQPKAPQFDVGSAARAGVSTYYDAQIKNATLDNLDVQNQILKMRLPAMAQDIAKKQAETVLSKKRADRSDFDLDMLKATRDLQIQTLEANLKGRQASTQMTLDENARRAALQAPTLEKAVQAVVNLKAGKELTDQQVKESRARIALMVKDGSLKDFEIMLNRKGVTKGDPAYMRMLSTLIDYVTSGRGLPGITPDKNVKRVLKDSPIDFFLPFK